jgi:SAM-dependent methyltransferase
MLEGDDYWIDDKKLYFQFLLMEENLDLVGCHTLALRSRESSKHLYEQKFDLLPAKNTRKDFYTLKDFTSDNGIMTGTVLLRREIFDKIKNQIGKAHPGDWLIFSLMAQFGNFLLYNKVTTIYRVHESNFWVTQTPSFRIKKSIDFLQHLDKIIKMYHDEISKSIERKIETLQNINHLNSKVVRISLFTKLIFSSKYSYLFFLFTLNFLNFKFCPICQNRTRYFRHLDSKFTENLIRYGWDLPSDDSEMCNFSEYHCPRCDASDRERFYSHWLLVNRKQLEGKRFLDIAPNNRLSEFILNFIKPSTYMTLDLFSEEVDINLDIQNMNIFPDNLFDFVLCSHVLEHVTDDEKALREIYRILKANSVSLLIAPISLSLETTREDPDVKDPAERWKLFGQDDHVRHYAKHDFINRVLDANFNLDFYDRSNSTRFIYRVLGFSKTSTLYLGKK